jgi:uncharacterized protein (UPF0332 family)
MKAEAAAFLAKAKRSVDAARRLLGAGDLDFAIGRAYYAMFYAAEALLVERGRRFRKHSGVHAAFGEEFTKSGQLDPKFHRWLLDAFDLRAESDYGTDLQLSEEDVRTVIDHAEDLLAEARRLFAGRP